jgi:hypothetical protein
MSTAFEILARFLDRTESEVEGRSMEQPAPAMKVKLRQFARGELPEAEQKALFDQLSRNRHWIPVLADEVKSLRPPPAGNPQN